MESLWLDEDIGMLFSSISVTSILAVIFFKFEFYENAQGLQTGLIESESAGKPDPEKC